MGCHFLLQKLPHLKQIRCPYKVWNPILCVCTSVFNSIWVFETPWTVACQVPLSMGFSRQEYWSELPFPFQGIFPTQGWNSRLLCLLHWEADSLPLSHLGRPGGVQSLIVTGKKKRWKCQSLNHVGLFASQWTVASQSLCPWDSPGKNTGMGSHSPLQGSSQPRDWTCVSCTEGRFFIVWATREAFHCWLTSPPNIWTNRLNGSLMK